MAQHGFARSSHWTLASVEDQWLDSLLICELGSFIFGQRVQFQFLALAKIILNARKGCGAPIAGQY